MEVVIRGKKATFNDNVNKYSYDEFEKLCLNMPVFIQLPLKERNNKIKELYGKYFPNAKKIPKSKSGSDLHSNNDKSDRGNIGTEPSADVGGENLKGEKDRAKVQKQKLRKENQK